MNNFSSYIFINTRTVDRPLSLLSKMPFYEIALKIFFACLLFSFTPPCHVAASYTQLDGNEASLPAKPGNVNLSVYYETLSPTCSNFIVQNLEGVFNNDLISIINLRLVPWGDANISKSNNAFICKVTLLLNLLYLGWTYFAYAFHLSVVFSFNFKPYLQCSFIWFSLSPENRNF